ncbi:MAG: glucosyltransferase [Bryobacterales bacterium]|nr:glucosyltransferase [Bryobacterales bacterium]
MARIVLNTFGSFGDLHPYLAVAIGLKRRGHEPIVATAELYRAKVEAEGIGFAPIRPDIGEMADNKAFLRKVWDPKRGTEFLLRDYIMPAVEQSFEDLLPVCEKADLLLTHAAAYAGPVLAEYLKLRWLSVVLQPMAFLSRYDPPVLPPALWLKRLDRFGPSVIAVILQIGKRKAGSWAKPVTVLRRKLNLPPSEKNPLFEGQFSPFGTLAWFSDHYAQPQPDWPARTRITGFPFYDQLGAGLKRWSRAPESDAAELAEFLAKGPPPVLFTLGSSAVMEPGDFYRESFAAAQHLGVRAILLSGGMPRESFPQPLPSSVCIASYAPYSEVMPFCAASVHQGGIGTTAQALRAGKPMMVVPWAHDQPDNAARITKLGCGRTIPRKHYTAARAIMELKQVLANDGYARTAQRIGSQIANEDGVENACSAIEQFLIGE